MYLFKIFLITWSMTFYSSARGGWSDWGTHNRETDIVESRDKAPPETTSIDLSFNSQKPLYYEQGIQKLMSFRGKPACQQIAAKILVVECQNLDKLGANAEESESLDDALYAHAVSIAICHLYVARAEVPTTCDRYGKVALSEAYHRGDYKALRGTTDEVQACVEDLFKDGRSWTTLSNLLQDGRAICRAARYDIERDHVIDTNIKVTSAMQEIFDQFKRDMLHTSEVRTSQDNDMSEMIRSWLAKLEVVKVEDMSILEHTRENLENLENGVKSASNVIFDIQNAFADLINSGRRAVQEHESAVAVNKDVANRTQNGLEIIGVVNKDLAILLQLSQQQNQAVAEFNRNINILNHRIVVMDDQVANVTNSMASMSTDLKILSNQHEQIVGLFGSWSSTLIFLCEPTTWMIVFAMLSAIALLALRRWVLLFSLSTICMVNLAWDSYSTTFQNAAQMIPSLPDIYQIFLNSIYVRILFSITTIIFIAMWFIQFLKHIHKERKAKKEYRETEKLAAAIRSEREANDTYYG